jgi:hypothetical protein
MALISVHDASERSGLSTVRLFDLLGAGVLKGSPIGQTWILDTRSLDRYTKTCRRAASARPARLTSWRRRAES